tara:strand:+ start:201 stop:710 length:510 start_codon:yes stop_codon:yes gene_type:complete
MRFLIIFIFLVSNSFAKEVNGIKNLVLIEKPKKYESLTFLDDQNNQVDISQYKGKLILLNFWATWCAPCKEEMPSLNSLQTKDQLNNLKIFPINVGQDDPKKASSFFDDLNINNLKPYFDSPVTLAKKFQLRGIPTSIIINQEGEEFARIIGSIDFEDKKFVEWLSKYN